jgi:hypothetical protein
MPKQTIRSSKVLPSFHGLGIEYDQLVDLAFRSAALFHPECRMVLLTSLDYQAAFSSEISGRVEIRRHDVDCAQPMVERMSAETSYLQTYDFVSPVVIMDGDMLVNANLEPLFERSFDVALTYNEGRTETDKKMPINGGLKLVNNKNPQAAVHFFQRTHDICCSEKLKEYRTWWGDQYALIESVGIDKFWGRSIDEVTVDNIKVLLLPCDEFNFTPGRKAREIATELKNKKVLHFRGARKRYMFMYWRLYLALRESPKFTNTLRAFLTRMHLYVGIMLQNKR